VLMRKQLADYCYVLNTNNPRISGVCCQLNKDVSMVFCNVYMPDDDGSNHHITKYEAVAGDMQDILDKCLGSKFVFGGDLNIEKHAVNSAQSCIANFCNANKILLLDHTTGNVDYTFHCNSLGNNSLIYYFLCSPELVAGAQSVTINSDGDSLSDHLSILCSLNVPKSLGTIKNNSSCVWKSQWNKADIEWYKSVVTDYLDSLAPPTEALHCNALTVIVIPNR